jgi:hypothetical protein
VEFAEAGGAWRQRLGGGYVTRQGGSGLVLRLAGLVAKQCVSQVAVRQAWPETALPQLASSRAPKPGEGSRAPHMIGLVAKRCVCAGAKRSGARHAGVDFVFLGEWCMRQ